MLRIHLFWISIIAFNRITAVTLTKQDPINISQQLKQCPWLPSGFKFSSDVLRLHEDINQFYEYMQPTPNEHALRESVVARFESLVLELWPEAYIKLYGSYSNGLALPDSDIDIMVLGVTDPSYLQSLIAKLEASDIAEPTSVVLRDQNVRIPIIEFNDRESNISIDIKFTNDPAVNFADLVNDQQYEAYLKLMFVLKQYLKQRNLNDVFTGGISSFTVSIMCINFLQMHHNSKYNEDLNLGELLLGFLELYGHKFDYETTGISVRNGGNRLPRSELPCGMVNGNYPLFCVERPLEYWINDGIETYRGTDVKEALADAHNLLSRAMYSVKSAKNESNDCADYSVLSHIVHVTDDFIRKRSLVDASHDNSSMLRTKRKHSIEL